ncbi:hypothetical protein BAE44_0010983 [Dichanthelium oligosanthes]|uniref:Uncharacterized protein n=1 Tax=Dichanthelium oligosanthes TaxID=888268 RepID=A0A1E5VS91_9POAL|nr:hypothetical protein BAE44_0010983 [Dichanthelium oligosanthes]
MTPPGTPCAFAPSPPSGGVVGFYFAVELCFDPALENQVLKAWNAMARRQLGSRLIDAASPPAPPGRCAPAARDRRGGGDPLLRLAPSLRALASQLDNDNVLFLAPTPSAALLGLHAQLCEEGHVQNVIQCYNIYFKQACIQP